MWFRWESAGKQKIFINQVGVTRRFMCRSSHILWSFSQMKSGDCEINRWSLAAVASVLKSELSWNLMLLSSQFLVVSLHPDPHWRSPAPSAEWWNGIEDTIEWNEVSLQGGWPLSPRLLEELGDLEEPQTEAAARREGGPLRRIRLLVRVSFGCLPSGRAWLGGDLKAKCTMKGRYVPAGMRADGDPLEEIGG